MIVDDLGDVDMALEYVQKYKNRDLWTELVMNSVTKPEFVGGRYWKEFGVENGIKLIIAMIIYNNYYSPL